MANFTLRVNGRTQTVDVDPATPLLYVLRNDLDLHGPRFGCGLGQCGACTVLIKGDAVRSCIRPISSVNGAEITTLEGLAAGGRLHPVQQAWIDEQVPQCGFCQNGQILTATALLDRNPNPTDAQIRQAMSSTLCRCMTYYRVQAAIKRAVAMPRADGGAVPVEPGARASGGVEVAAGPAARDAVETAGASHARDTVDAATGLQAQDVAAGLQARIVTVTP
jgi:aerobic-type carbon monoxide dehydrogenase small subunit (CoxS/CutS family)